MVKVFTIIQTSNLKLKIIQMNFDLTEDQIAIRDAARDFAENEIAPSAIERDKNAEFPKDIVKKTWRTWIPRYDGFA